MKAFVRVLVLAALVIVAVSCSHTKSILPTIETNELSAVLLTFESGAKANGVIAHCSNEMCLILTAAHICNPIVLSDSVMENNIAGNIDDLEAETILGEYAKSIANKTFCNGTVFLKGHKVSTTVKPILIDYSRDLMIMATHLPDTKTNIGISSIKSVKPRTSLYTIVVDPHFYERLILFSKAGLAGYGKPARGYSYNYLQAYFPIGPGASGSGVFLEESNLLVGIIGAQFISGASRSPIRATYIIQVEDIRSVFKQYHKARMETKHDSKLDWPYCYGKEYLCKLVHAEISLMEALGHSLNERDDGTEADDKSESSETSGSDRNSSLETAEETSKNP